MAGRALLATRQPRAGLDRLANAPCPAVDHSGAAGSREVTLGPPAAGVHRPEGGRKRFRVRRQAGLWRAGLERRGRGCTAMNRDDRQPRRPTRRVRRSRLLGSGDGAGPGEMWPPMAAGRRGLARAGAARARYRRHMVGRRHEDRGAGLGAPTCRTPDSEDAVALLGSNRLGVAGISSSPARARSLRNALWVCRGCY